MKNIKTTSYLNRESGEFIEKKQFVDAQFDDNGYLLFKSKFGVKTYLDIKIPDCFTWSERGRIDELRHYILRDNQLLVCRTSNAIRPINTNDIANILQMSARQCKTFVKKLKQSNIIREIDITGSTYFCFNPIYGLKDKRLSLTTFIIYQDVLKEYLPKWVYLKFIEQAADIKPNIKSVK